MSAGSGPNLVARLASWRYFYMVNYKKPWVVMNYPVYYRMVLLDLADKKEEVIDVIAFCVDRQGGIFNCKFGSGHPEASISEGNIKKTYAKTGPIYKLLYL